MHRKIAMKKIIYLLLVIPLLSACGHVKDTANDFYKKEKPLEIKMVLPASVSKGKQTTIKAILTQDKKTVDDADFVHFEIWKQDGSVKFGMEEAENEGKGLYSISKQFDTDGLYYIKVHAGNADSTIMPQHQLVVGKLSEQEKRVLQEGQTEQSTTHEHHH